jgi:hypothetical protein
MTYFIWPLVGASALITGFYIYAMVKAWRIERKIERRVRELMDRHG